MHYSAIKKRDIANGPGVRVSLFVSGCRRHCKECFNQDTWDFNNGDEFTSNIEEDILDSLAPDFIKGFSLLGGEPFEPENVPVLSKFLSRVRERYPDKTIWCYTGYKVEELKKRNNDDVNTMLDIIDVLVDGPFHNTEKIIDLRFRGSTNQRILDLDKDKPEIWKDPYIEGAVKKETMENYPINPPVLFIQ